MMRARWLAVCLGAVLAAGCAEMPSSGDQGQTSQIGYGQTPPAVRLAFDEQHPRANVQSVDKTTYEDKSVRYIIRYVEQGQFRTAEFTPEGHYLGAPAGAGPWR